MGLDALRVEQPVEPLQLQRISPERKQQALDARFSNYGNSSMLPQWEQGDNRPLGTTAPTWESAQESLFQEVTLPEHRREQNQQQAQGAIDLIGNMFEPGAVVADLANLDEGSLERFIIENADLIGGLGTLSAKGLKRLATTEAGRKLARAIAVKKQQAGMALDDISRMMLGGQPEFAMINGAPSNLVGDVKPLLSGLSDKALGTTMGVSGVMQLDDIGIFSKADPRINNPFKVTTNTKSGKRIETKFDRPIEESDQLVFHGSPKKLEEVDVIGQSDKGLHNELAVQTAGFGNYFAMNPFHASMFSFDPDNALDLGNFYTSTINKSDIDRILVPRLRMNQQTENVQQSLSNLYDRYRLKPNKKGIDIKDSELYGKLDLATLSSDPDDAKYYVGETSGIFYGDPHESVGSGYLYDRLNKLARIEKGEEIPTFGFSDNDRKLLTEFGTKTGSKKNASKVMLNEGIIGTGPHYESQSNMPELVLFDKRPLNSRTILTPDMGEDDIREHLNNLMQYNNDIFSTVHPYNKFIDSRKKSMSEALNKDIKPSFLSAYEDFRRNPNGYSALHMQNTIDKYENFIDDPDILNAIAEIKKMLRGETPIQ